jgi:uncharacterized protein YdhG (YjbR/CyaY superfamily)
MSETPKSAASGFTKDERAAMRERAKELKANATREQESADLLTKIGEMSPPQRVLAERIHEIVTENAPQLAPKTWYGMPGWAIEGRVAIFFQSADKFGARYSTLGFNDNAIIDDGTMWPTAYALTELTPAVERHIVALVKKVAA